MIIIFIYFIGICCNIYGFDKDESPYIFPLYISPDNYETNVHLLMITKKDQSHYILIKSIDAFLRTRTKHMKKMSTCIRCLQSFSSKYILDRHWVNCSKGKIQQETMPDDSKMMFKNFKNRIANTVTIYADFEAIQIRCKTKAGAQTEYMTEHEPSGFGYIVVSPFPELCQPYKSYRGTNGNEVSKKFIEAMHMEYNRVSTRLHTIEPMIYTDNDHTQFVKASSCSICYKELDWSDREDLIVKDHCHISGVFRGAAHSSCNLKMQQNKKINIFMHNASGYDNHFVVKSIEHYCQVQNIDVVANTKEKFVQISTPKMVFRDSFSHLNSSLDDLVRNLRSKGDHLFPLLREMFREDDKFQACLQKMIYPYMYMDSFKKFDEKIPGPDKFYNDLTEEDLEEKEYQRLLYVCKLFNVQTMGQLHDLYLMIDVLLLASVFESYRQLGLDEYGLDPAHYVSAPSFSFDAMLFKTGVELELISEAAMYSFFESGKRGGLCSIFNRLVSSNCDKSFNYDNRVDPSTLFYTGIYFCSFDDFC